MRIVGFSWSASSTPMSIEATTSSPPMFMLGYRIAVDGQWRATVPAAWRFAERAQLFIRKKDDHLLVIPQSEVDRILEKINQRDGADRDALLAAWARRSAPTKIDSAGRITLPKDWAADVGIKAGKKVYMAGGMINFQIWDADRYETDPGGMQSRGDKLLAEI